MRNLEKCVRNVNTANNLPRARSSLPQLTYAMAYLYRALTLFDVMNDGRMTSKIMWIVRLIRIHQWPSSLSFSIFSVLE